MRLTTSFNKLKRNHVMVVVVTVMLALGILGNASSFGRGLNESSHQIIAPLNAALAGPGLPLRRTEVPLNSVRLKRVMVALVFGQSNSANHGDTPYTSHQRVYNFYQGKLYRARDPLLGATGKGGSVWTRLGDKLIDGAHYDAVVFVPIGVGKTSIAHWTVGGKLHEKVLDAIREVEAQGLSITHLLWHQGESDAHKISTRAYKVMFQDMLASIRSRGVDAPIYVSVATRCHTKRPDETIRRAQRELVNRPQSIYAGPDTDRLGLRYRYDQCHFSAEGLEKFAKLWLKALEPK